MAGDPQSGDGLISSVRRIGDTFLAIVKNRLELAAIELSEQKHQMLEALLLFAVFFFLATLAVIFLTATIIILFWDQAGPLLLLGFTVFYFVAACWALVAFKKRLQKWPQPFADTISEIEKDRQCLHPQK